MADLYFGQNIAISAGFDLAAQKPLDSRTVVHDSDELNAMPTIRRYHGLKVFVEAEDMTYVCGVDLNFFPEVLQGKAATVKIGTVTTGDAGSEAVVTNSGTENDAVLDFVIPKGERGADGAAATVAIGTVKTLDSDKEATVVNSGTESAAVLDIGIPRGLRGKQGPKGDKGDPFSIKKTYASIAEMEADFSNIDVEEGQFVMISSTIDDEDNAKLYVKGATSFTFVTDMSGAQGIKGEPGPQGIQGEKGDDGAAATIAVGTVTTGAAGSDAAVENSGTSNAAVLDFTIPKGDKGDNGDMIKVGTEYATAQEAKIFFKVVS